MHVNKFVYEGKSKRVYALDGDTLVMEFKDEVTAFDGTVKAIAMGKGIIAARLSTFFFKFLGNNGIRSHFINYDGCRRITVKKLDIIPLEVIVRNYAYGSLLKRMPLYKPLQKLDPPIIEFHYKDDILQDPLVLEEDILRVKMLEKHELEVIKDMSSKINELLYKFFEFKNLRFVDIKLEFGKSKSGEILLADEISGDTFRVIDQNNNHLDKEIFRKARDVSLLLKAYIKLAEVVGINVNDIYASCGGCDN
ncbi:MAG: phosphoribosylaminoimidazolesuccinocarboxamide synthase [Ignisphaera sp.]